MRHLPGQRVLLSFTHMLGLRKAIAISVLAESERGPKVGSRCSNGARPLASTCCCRTSFVSPLVGILEESGYAPLLGKLNTASPSWPIVDGQGRGLVPFYSEFSIRIHFSLHLIWPLRLEITTQKEKDRGVGGGGGTSHRFPGSLGDSEAVMAYHIVINLNHTDKRNCVAPSPRTCRVDLVEIRLSKPVHDVFVCFCGEPDWAERTWRKPLAVMQGVIKMLLARTLEAMSVWVWYRKRCVEHMRMFNIRWDVEMKPKWIFFFCFHIAWTEIPRMCSLSDAAKSCPCVCVCGTHSYTT